LHKYNVVPITIGTHVEVIDDDCSIKRIKVIKAEVAFSVANGINLESIRGMAVALYKDVMHTFPPESIRTVYLRRPPVFEFREDVVTLTCRLGVLCKDSVS
jgi:hypothetical protein